MTTGRARREIRKRNAGRTTAKRISPRAAMVFQLLLLVALAAQTPAGAAAPVLDRVMDRVVLPGAKLGRTRDRAMDRLRLLACHSGKFGVIPFQIDEKNAKNEYVLTRVDGKKLPDEGPGKFDANDELVFLAKDTGEKCDPSKSGLTFSAFNEISLTDPQTGGQGFAYLLFFDQNPPPLSPTVYMHYRHEANRDTVSTPNYTVNFPKDNVFFNDLIILPAAGGNGKDLLDRIKMRSGVKLLSGALSINRTEEDFNHKLIGWAAGPVRIIRQTESSVALALGLHSPSATVVANYYPYSFEFPSILSLPFRMDLVASDAFFRQGFDLNRNAVGMKFYCNTLPAGATFDGKMSPDEVKMANDKRTHLWGLIAGPPGAMIYEGIWDRKSPISARLYYKDDLANRELPEEDPGSMNFSYLLEDLLKMGGEEYPFNISNYIIPNYDGNQEKARRPFEQPLAVKVNP